MRLFIRFLKLFFRNNLVVFCGVDGTGKTSMTKQMCETEGNLSFKRVYLVAESLEHLDRRLVSRLFKLRDCIKKYHKANPVGAACRIWAYIIRYIEIASRLAQANERMTPGEYLCCDRFTYDYFLRCKISSGFVKRIFILLFFYLFPKPKFIVLLSGNPKVIHERDPDLSENEISSGTRRFRDFFNEKKLSFLEIDTGSGSVANSSDTIINWMNENLKIQSNNQGR